MPDGEPIASFRAVGKSHDGIAEALSGFTLDIARGEFLTLLGPAGAGKSTALRLLAGLVAPTSGRVLLRGADATDVPAERRGLGVVFPAASLFPHRTVAENVAFPLTLRRLGRAERAANLARILSLLRLEGLAARYPAHLAAEERQRVALARALVFAPDLVLLDDPFATLQPEARAALCAEIRHIQRERGIAMLHATRDPDAALALSDRVALLHKGALQQLASPATLYEDPANLLAARFIGDACIVTIRPERVALAAISAREMGDAALSAVVLEVTYHGDHLRIRLVLGEDTELVVKRPAAAGMAGLGINQPVAVAWQGHHARAFLPEP